MIQTYHPEHYVITHACTQDYRSFFDEEIKFRERLGYPPFTSVASILIKHSRADHAMEQARIIARSLTRADSERRCRILGPAPAPLARLRGEQRVQVLLKSKSRSALRDVLDRGLATAEAEGCDMKTAVVEIDPISLL
jgi:primosomal protein N' (replication factor Y)